MPTPVPTSDLPESVGTPVPDDDLPGSVFDKRSFFKRAVGTAKKVTPEIAGAAVPIGLAVATGGESVPVQLGAAALGGAAQPIITRGLAGQPPPSAGEVLKSAAWNAGLQGLGEVPSLALGALKKGASEVAGDFAPVGVRSTVKTGKQIDAASRRRQLLIQSGMTPEEATAITADPVKAAAFDQNLKYATDTKKAFQQANDVKAVEMKTRFDSAIGQYKDRTIGTSPISDAIERELKGLGQQQASPGLQRFLEQKQQEMFLMGRSKAGGMSINEVQKFHDELWGYYPRGANANAVDQKLITQIARSSEGQIDTGLRAAGADADQIAKYHEARQDWNAWKTAVAKLDPRGKTFGTDVAESLFGQTAKNPDQALYYARMVSAADKLNFGVKQQFATSWLDHFMGEARNESGAIGQMQAFSKFRREFASSGTKGTGQAFLNEIFGVGSPMANETKFASIMGKLGDPTLTARAQNGVKQYASDPTMKWIIRNAAILGGYHLLTGKKGGIFAAMTDPEGWAVLGAYLVGKRFSSSMLAAGGKVSNAYADWLLNPNATNFGKFIHIGAAVAGAGAADLATSDQTPAPQSP